MRTPYNPPLDPPLLNSTETYSFLRFYGNERWLALTVLWATRARFMPVYTVLYFTLQLTILSICSTMLPTLHLLERNQTTGAMAAAQDNDVIG